MGSLGILVVLFVFDCFFRLLVLFSRSSVNDPGQKLAGLRDSFGLSADYAPIFVSTPGDSSGVREYPQASALFYLTMRHGFLSSIGGVTSQFLT